MHTIFVSMVFVYMKLVLKLCIYEVSYSTCSNKDLTC